MTKAKKIMILFGDILILYGALILTMIFRYGPDYFKEPFYAHFKPFSLIFVIWIVIFYLADLYKEKRLIINPAMIQAFVLAIIIGVVSSIILFYLFPLFFKLTPKTNLAVFTLIFGVLALGWRIILVKIYISGGWRNRLLLIGDSPVMDEIVNYLKDNPQLGYEINGQIKEYSTSENYQSDTIIIQPHFKKEPEFIKTIYQLLPKKIAIIDLITFYETIFQKLPLEELEESWFIEKITTRRHLYDAAKRIIDIVFSLILGVVFLPFMAVIALLIKLTSKGPVIYTQERVGLNNKAFTLFKFRTMYHDPSINADAFSSAPQWSKTNDTRVTKIGKIFRYTHLDEIPQLINILKGDLSFVGPRPERPEFVSQLKEKIPYYEIRHLIKPGFTGWAQINYRYGASIKDAYEKLQYDIYYLKNRSVFLDILIFLKTIRLLFSTPQ